MEEIQREDAEKFRGKLCIDTSAAIVLINKKNMPAGLIDFYEGDIPCVISAVTMFELLMRKTNIVPVERFLFRVQVLPFNDKAARKASQIQKELVNKGKIVDYRDIFIAATAIENGCDLITLNRKDFENIEGLKVVEIQFNHNPGI